MNEDLKTQAIKKEKELKNKHTTGLSGLLKVRLANSVFATVMLITGSLYKWILPENEQFADLIIALGAVVVSLPIFIEGLKGLFCREPKFMTEQIVSLAILASMLQGDFVSAVIIPAIMVAGHLMEEKSIMGISDAIAALEKLHNEQARLIKEDGSEECVEASDLKIGDIIVSYPGEIISADGSVTEGESSVNQAPITGESVPVDVYPGTHVFAGTINLSGKIFIKVTKLSVDTVFSKIAASLADAEKSKAPIVKIIEKYLGLYFPFVIMIAAITLFVTGNVERAVAVLVISCPCALVLASPSAMIAALVRAARLGIMIKNTAFLEVLSDIDTVVFDKTGTVTLGHLQAETIEPEEGISEIELLSAAGACAAGSIHPVSAAIAACLHEKGITIPTVKSHKEYHGRGVEADMGTKKYYIGKLEWLQKICDKDFESDLPETGKICSWVTDGETLLGRITFSDTPRPEMKNAIASLRSIGISNIILLTGDKREIADNIGEFLDVDETVAECLPQDKLDYVNRLKEEGHKVMFVGDGVNDALALKASDTGIAVAKGGSDIAVQNADIAFNSDNFMNLTSMFRLSSLARTIITQNIAIGSCFSFLLMGLASYGVISPVAGAVVHNIGPVMVVLNSARLLRHK